jgi:hypothetical protein
MKLLSEALVAGLRPVSKRFFNQELRLPVALAIGRDDSGLFTQTDLATAVHVRNSSSVQKPLDDLVSAGIVVREDRRANDRARWLRRMPSSMWGLAEEFAARIPVPSEGQTPGAAESGRTISLDGDAPHKS